MPDVIVIGAGVVGAATAHALTEAGAQVEVLEAGRIAGGTSTATFGVDVSRVKTPRALFDLSMAGTREHEELEATLLGTWRHCAASLEWEHSESGRQRLRARVQRLQAWGYSAEWVSRGRARRVEPALGLPTGGEADEVAFYRDGAWYEPRVLAGALLARARAHGARVCEDDPVTGMRTAQGRIAEVETAAGRRISADVVVNCGGPQAAAIAALAAVALPLRRVPGLVVVTTPAAPGLQTIVAAVDLNLRPHTGHRVMLHSWRLDAELGSGPTWPNAATLAQRLLDRARVLLPGLGRAEVHSARVGVRPIPLDGLPVVGVLPGLANFYAVVAHSAAHLAPVLGRLAAEDLTGSCPAQLGPFRPTRSSLGDEGREPADESTRTMLAQVMATTTWGFADAI